MKRVSSNLILRPAENRGNPENPEAEAVAVAVADSGGSVETRSGGSTRTLDLGNGSQVVYVGRFLGYEESWNYFHYLNKHIPWTRPTIRVFGRSSVQVLPLPQYSNPTCFNSFIFILLFHIASSTIIISCQ